MQTIITTTSNDDDKDDDNDKEQGETKADANIPECHFYETTLL